MSDKSDELKIEGEETEETPEGGERLTPDVEADFLGLLKDYGVAEKAAKTITKHIAETGTANVFEDPKQLLEKMAKFPRHVPPVTRKNILDHWIASRDITVPEGFEEEADLPAEELKSRKARGTTPEKYSVDTDTGAIKVATTADKALTWDEAEKLSKEIKKDIEARGRGEKEPAFLLGDQGNWTLNPEAKIGFGEFAVFQMYQDSLRKGEPIDPVEELAKREEASVRLKEAMGVKTGVGDTEMTTLDKLDKLGLIRKPGEEGRSSQIEMLSQLNELGLLKKTGEGEGSETIRALQTEIKDLRDALQKQEMDSLKTAVAALNNQLTDLRKEMSDQGKLEGRYAILSKSIDKIDSQLTGFRTDARPLLETFAQGGSPEPRTKSPEERQKIAKGVKEAVAMEREARDLEDELMFGGKQG